ncbi:MAG TPA: iron chelate uptake ABC transporter family permease subunit [Candidatus Limnocylindrales bacterium]|nr:iron chelate uptake ABC transporter family permease subunit [Candidatus Limnocylindrales bacterium]
MTTTPLPAGAPGRLALGLRAGRLGRAGWLAVAGVVSLVVVLIGGIVLGSVDLAPLTTVGILAKRLLGLDLGLGWAPTTEAIVMDLRLPRVLTAMVVGTGLAVAGATFQGLLRNPLADPYVLGTASGAALGAAIAVLIPVRGLVLEFGLLHGLAFIGALLSVTVVYRLSRTSALAPLTGLLLTGYAVGSLLAAGLSLAMYMSGSGLRQIFSFLLGGFDGTSWGRLAVAAPLIIGGTLLILLRARSLNGFLLGEEAAFHLGVDVRKERAILLALASLVTAAGVAIAGLIGFVGLVVPHLVRLLVGPNARLVLPISALFGASLLAAADVVARMLGGVPVGVVTAVIGAPFFLLLLRRARTGYEL